MPISIYLTTVQPPYDHLKPACEAGIREWNFTRFLRKTALVGHVLRLLPSVTRVSRFVSRLQKWAAAIDSLKLGFLSLITLMFSSVFKKAIDYDYLNPYKAAPTKIMARSLGISLKSIHRKIKLSVTMGLSA